LLVSEKKYRTFISPKQEGSNSIKNGKNVQIDTSPEKIHK
jgi:hypothetical protein